MGVLQSLTNYFYPPQTPALSAHAITTKARRLSLSIQQAQCKLQQATIKLEHSLLAAVNAPLARSREGEKVLMEAVIRNSQKLLVYDEVVLALSLITREAHILEGNPSAISNNCVVAINSLVFVYELMGLGEFVNLCEFIPQPHPVISIEKITPVLQKYLGQKQVSHYDLNLYTCQLSARHGTSLQLFNSVGHAFEEHPAEPEEETPSAHMFAITLEDLELEEMAGGNGQPEPEMEMPIQQ